jgi:hypothetical protein
MMLYVDWRTNCSIKYKKKCLIETNTQKLGGIQDT